MAKYTPQIVDHRELNDSQVQYHIVCCGEKSHDVWVTVDTAVEDHTKDVQDLQKAMNEKYQ